MVPKSNTITLVLETVFSSTRRIILGVGQTEGSVLVSHISNFFFFLAMPSSMWDLSSLTWDQTCAPCSGSVAS